MKPVPKDTLYYLARNGEQAGPYTIGQLRTMWQSGNLTAHTQYWFEGEAAWQQLINIQNILEPSAGTTSEQQKTFKFKCHTCGQRISALLTKAGQTGQCPSCKSSLDIPIPPSLVEMQHKTVDESAPAARLTPFLAGERGGLRSLALIIDYSTIGLVWWSLSKVPIMEAVLIPVFLLYLISRDVMFGGRSLGKLLCGLIVINTVSGLPVTWWQACLRQLLFYGPLGALIAAAAFLPPIFISSTVIVGVLVIAREISNHGHSYFDRGARALVVKKSEYDATRH